ncbi:hypothetical protein [Spongiactinospora rosea]|nr:hypothetical protein [Spongiactinospora rosea]
MFLNDLTLILLALCWLGVFCWFTMRGHREWESSAERRRRARW